MTTLPQPMAGTYDPRIVALSVAIAAAASYVALNLAERVTATRGAARAAWLVGGAAAMGSGIWSMHFTGMLALHLPVPIAYDMPLAALSLIVAIAASGVALLVVGQRTLTLRSWLYGGVLMGSGIAAMHYIGMAALRMRGVTSYNPAIFTLSAIIAIAVSLAALWLSFRLRDATPRRIQWRRVVSALVMGVAIAGMHYTGMAAASFTRAPMAPHAMAHVVNASALGSDAIAFVALLVLGLTLGAALVDRRIENTVRASELHFRSVTQSANDAIISADRHGTITFWNKGATDIFGYTEQEALGQPVTMIMPERYRALHQGGLNRMSATGEPHVIGHTVELEGLCKDGSEFPLELSLSTWTTDEGVFYSGIIRDITLRKRSEERLALQYAATTVLAAAPSLEEAAPRILRTVCERLGWDAGTFWSIDPQDDVLHCLETWQQPHVDVGRSLALSRQLTFSRGMGLPGRTWDNGEPIVRPDLTAMTPDPGLPRLRQAVAEGLRSAFCFPIKAGGEVHSVMEFYSRETWQHGEDMTQAIAAIGAQIGQFIERRQAEEALRHQALHDALTGLPNRTLLRERLDQELRAARRDRSPLALLLMDLNRFKEVNDTLGHHLGDQLLLQVGSRVCEALRATDTVARLGGDEFAILVPGADGSGAVRVAHKILAALAAPFAVDDQELSVGASIGIALCPTHGDDPQALLRQADVAMYVAKRAGSGYAVYDVAHDRHSPALLTLESGLRQAIAQGDLTLYYQPKAHVISGRIERVEALVRWRHPEHGIIPPDQFIPLAEQTGLIAPLTTWVLETALRQCQTWQRVGRRLGVAVNLSMRTINDGDLPDTVAWLLQRYEIAPELLTLEVTESALMVDPAQAQAVLTRLAELGVRLSIDDFGTGYSSLGYLKQLPVDEIKIDKSFVLGMSGNDKDTAIVRSVSELSHNLGLSVVAEGVEDRATWDLLARMGCDMAQGYYLSRPLPVEDLDRWIVASPWAVA